jgi:hypothetical protein
MVVRAVVDHRQFAEEIAWVLKSENGFAPLRTLGRQFDHSGLEQIHRTGLISGVKDRLAALEMGHSGRSEDRQALFLAEHREEPDALQIRET